MQTQTASMLKQRKRILEGRAGKENGNIVKKLDRKIRKLEDKDIHAS